MPSFSLLTDRSFKSARSVASLICGRSLLDSHPAKCCVRLSDFFDSVVSNRRSFSRTSKNDSIESSRSTCVGLLLLINVKPSKPSLPELNRPSTHIASV